MPLFDNCVTDTFWPWSLALMYKSIRKAIGSYFIRAGLPRRERICNMVIERVYCVYVHICFISCRLYV
jgi:hypothetical protein